MLWPDDFGGFDQTDQVADRTASGGQAEDGDQGYAPANQRASIDRSG
jgi:hypothetical protein